MIPPVKAYQIARDAAGVGVFLVSEMPPGLVRDLLLAPKVTIREALTGAISALGTDIDVAVMPHAASTVPQYVQDSGG